ncbi:MAG: hypothetical protein Q9211_001444 [Gyalolechia sp. 1 TL-2023]
MRPTTVVHHGLGRHIWVAPKDARVVWAQGLFVSELSYELIMCSTKFSLLAFYWRIFKQSKIRIPIYVLVAVVSCWGIAGILVILLQCQPVSEYWNRFAVTDSAPHCGVNITQFFYGVAIPNILTDAALLVLPMPFIWKLHLPRAQKLALTSIFILGAFVIGVSITRFTVLLKLNLVSPDITWNYVDNQIWTAVESHVGIICACLPSLRPLLNVFLFGSVDRTRGSRSDGKSHGGRGDRSYDRWGSNVESHAIAVSNSTRDLADKESGRDYTQVSFEGQREGSSMSVTNIELDNMHGENGIQVRTDVYIDGYGTN